MIQDKITLTRDKHIIYILNPKFPDVKLRFDLKNQRMEKLKKGEWIKVDRQYAFFNGWSINDIVCEEEHFKGMILQTAKLNPYCTSLSSFISRMGEALNYENYIREGIKAECCVSGRRDIMAISEKRLLQNL